VYTHGTTHLTHHTQNDNNYTHGTAKRRIPKIKISITPKRSELSMRSAGGLSTQAFTNRSNITTEKFLKFHHIAKGKTPPVIL
jgi:hypothetical protein